MTEEEPGIVLNCLEDNDSASQPKRFFVTTDVYVDVVEEFGENLEFSSYSNTIWDGALLASSYFRRNPWLLKGKTLVELGSGLGLPSLVAATCGAIATATEQEPLHLLRREVQRNSDRLRRVGGQEVKVKALDWEWEASDILRKLESEPFDIVLGCDILAGVKSGSRHFRLILQIAATILKQDGVALFTWIPRMGRELREFTSCIEEELPEFSVTVLEKELFDPEFLGEGSMLKLQRRGYELRLDEMD
mmetsp:Transcript_16595/g.35754  ORF Transcript_16595/g.35754 Transcript_16595/m.35754 type:complete len:248 (+) Transcript_16595:64-807(+)